MNTTGAGPNTTNQYSGVVNYTAGLTNRTATFQATALAGDYLKFTSDGIHFFVDGRSTAGLGISVP
jgi:hypothetical protein